MSAADLPAQDWRHGATIYQIYPRSFADSNGDGVGDLPGITAKLEHVASLGVDGIWLSPFYRSPMKDFGYDIADPFDVDPVFGTLADFDALVEKAHALGLKVIVDQVYCHLSDQSAWFEESRASRDNPKADWFVWADPKPDGSPPSNWQSVFHGPSWRWDARRQQYHLHNFLPEQPDLNVHHPEVQEALLQVARFWLDRGVDGFRLDAINFAMHDPQLRDNPPAPPDRHRSRPFDFQDHDFNQSHPAIPAFLERVQAVVDERPGRFTVAEIGGENALAEMREYTKGPKRLATAYSFDFLYAQKLTPRRLKSAILNWSEEASPGGWPSWAFSNHDAPRAISRWWPDLPPERIAPFALLLLLSLRGNVFLYEGEELGLPQGEVPFERLVDPEAIENWPRTLGRDGARTPIPWKAQAPHGGFSDAEPWLPMDPRHAAMAVDRQEADPRSVLNFTRAAVAFRQASEALRSGSLSLLDVPEPLVGWTRGERADQVICVFNLGDAPVLTPPSGLVLFATPGIETGEKPPRMLAPLAAYWAERA